MERHPFGDRSNRYGVYRQPVRARALRGSASRRCRYQSDRSRSCRGNRDDSRNRPFCSRVARNVGEGVPGYVTPKIAIGAVVGNDDGDILLVQRRESGVWLYPTGWADVGYSPSEVAVKEVEEETGIICEPVRLLSVIDGQRMGFSRFGMYMLLFHCRATGGTLEGHPLETSDVGWFSEDALPEVTAGAQWWGPMAFAAIRGEPVEAGFDSPRSPVWRADS